MFSLWQELKRRNVVKVAVAYAAVAWLVLQIADVVLGNIGAPLWVIQTLMLLLAIGFPLSVLFAWAFELTPDGIKRERDVDRNLSVTRQTGRRLNTVIIGGLLLAVGFLVLERFVWHQQDEPVVTEVGERRTIAVLPFVNRSDDPEQEYFSEGLAEELLNLLARIPELRVTSRTSAFSFKESDLTVREIGHRLGVDHILEGSVRRSGNTIRISTQLVNVASDANEWTNTWDRSFEDVFAIQDEIAEAVVGALRITLLNDIPTVNETSEEAYTLYLQARNQWRRGTGQAFEQAESMYLQVLELDPDYAPAVVGLAGIYYFGSAGLGVWEPHFAMPKAKAYAQRAIEMGATNGRPHAILAQIAYSYDYEIEVAETALSRALELGESDALVQSVASFFARQNGDFLQSIEFAKRADAIDPVSDWVARNAPAYWFAGRTDEALDLFRRRVEDSPDASRVHADLALGLFLSGKPEEALDVIDREVSEGHKHAGKALFYHAIGDAESSDREFQTLLSLGIRWTYETAEVYAFRGDADQAFIWLNRAIDRRDPGLGFLFNSPFLDNIRGDPRFADVLRRMGHTIAD